MVVMIRIRAQTHCKLFSNQPLLISALNMLCSSPLLRDHAVQNSLEPGRLDLENGIEAIGLGARPACWAYIVQAGVCECASKLGAQQWF